MKLENITEITFQQQQMLRFFKISEMLFRLIEDILPSLIEITNKNYYKETDKVEFFSYIFKTLYLFCKDNLPNKQLIMESFEILMFTMTAFEFGQMALLNEVILKNPSFVILKGKEFLKQLLVLL